MTTTRFGTLAFVLALLGACSSNDTPRSGHAGADGASSGGRESAVASGGTQSGRGSSAGGGIENPAGGADAAAPDSGGGTAGAPTQLDAGGTPGAGGTSSGGTTSMGGTPNGGTSNAAGAAGGTTSMGGTPNGGTSNAGSSGAPPSGAGASSTGAGGFPTDGGSANAGAAGTPANGGSSNTGDGIAVTPEALTLYADGGTGVVAIHVDTPAGPGGRSVELSSSSSVVRVPAHVVIPDGATSATVRLRGVLGDDSSAVVTASDGAAHTELAVSLTPQPPNPSAPGQIVIGEVNYDVPTAAPNSAFGDANCDGAVEGGSSASYDEFVELVNATSGPLAMSGVALWDGAATAPRFTFPSFVLGPGEAVVVFGGLLGTATIEPWCTNADGSHVGDARAFAGANLALNNGGDQVVVSWSATKSDVLDGVTFGAGTDESIVRSAELTGAFVPYTQAPGARTDRRSSPGTHTDGSPFAEFSAP